MRIYDCHPVGKPQEVQTIYVRDSDAYIRGLKPKTKYEIQRGGNLKIARSDSGGKIRIGVGYLME